MKVAVFWTNRSEEGLLKPVIKELKALGIEVDTGPHVLDPGVIWQSEEGHLWPINYGYLYTDIFKYLRDESKPDLVFAPFDRPEMLMVAQAAHYLDIPVAQIHAGDVSVGGSWDDQGRWAITALAGLLFCNGFKARDRVQNFKHLMYAGITWEKEAWLHDSRYNVYEVGSTAFDDIDLVKPFWDYNLEFEGNFDLILYNPPTGHLEEMEADLKHIYGVMKADRTVVWVGPNGDPGSDRVVAFVNRLNTEASGVRVNYHPSMKREEFLWCLKHAKRLIGNSSSFFVEAPTLRSQGFNDGDLLDPEYVKRVGIIHIGERNQGREYIIARTGGSKRIAEITKRYLSLRR